MEHKDTKKQRAAQREKLCDFVSLCLVKMNLRMRTITLIIIHCSATPEGKSLSFEACKRDHVENRHFRDIGYHYYITRDGHIHAGRPEEQPGAHCKNHNSHSIGICYEGGLNEKGKKADTRTPEQKKTLRELVGKLHQQFPKALIVGHHDLEPSKPCPCFDVIKEFAEWNPLP